HTAQGLDAGRGLKPEDPQLYKDGRAIPVNQLPSLEHGGTLPHPPRIHRPLHPQNLPLERPIALRPGSSEFDEFHARTMKIFEEAAAELFERFQMVFMGRRYLSKIITFRNVFRSSSNEGKVALLRTTFADLANPDIKRSVNEWHEWIENLQRLMNPAAGTHIEALSVELEVQIGLDNLVTRAHQTAEGSSRLITLPNVENLQQILLHRLMSSRFIWQTSPALKMVKWSSGQFAMLYFARLLPFR
ncbi:hypothetical protein O181_072780, partial [Austropuccinia psidii MF-1]|nr:hypothetical protein [Austropuccinia psidii MF-1]